MRCRHHPGMCCGRDHHTELLGCKRAVDLHPSFLGMKSMERSLLQCVGPDTHPGSTGPALLKGSTGFMRCAAFLPRGCCLLTGP